MSITTVNVLVPTSGDGPIASISHLVGSKTVELTGRFSGRYVLYGAHAGSSFTPILEFEAGGDESIRQTLDLAISTVYLRAESSNPSGVTLNISGVTSGTNYFTTVGTLSTGNSGLQSVIDLYALFPPSGIEQDINFICTGDFKGTISVRGSMDGSHFTPMASFRIDQQSPSLLGNSSIFKFTPVRTKDLVRYLQLDVVGAVISTTVITCGGSNPTYGANSVDLRVISLGDSHTAGVIGTPSEQFANGVINTSANWDPNAIGAGGEGSWVSYLESFLRQNTNKLNNVKVANIGSGGACTYTWAGVMSNMYFSFVGLPSDGETVVVGGVVYTFRNAFANPNDVVIQATPQLTAQWFGNVVSGVSGYGSTPNPQVFCPNPATTTLQQVFARRTGVYGNLIGCSSTAPNVLSLSPSLTPTTTLSGGAENSPLTVSNLDILNVGGFGVVDAITITLGTNEVARIGYDPNDFAYEASKLIAYLRSRYPNVQIVWWLPPNTGIPARNTALATYIRPALLNLQAANPSYLSVFDAYTVPVELTGLYLKLDGVHLTNLGYVPYTAQRFATSIIRARHL